MINKKWVRMAALVSNAVLSKCVLLYGGYSVGVYLDEKYASEPTFMMVGVVLALVLGTTYLILVANRVKF